MSNAIVMTGYGPPEVLKWAAVPLPEPGPGQIRVKVKAAGISPFHLTRIFKKAIGMSPHQYLIEVRVHSANALLAAGPEHPSLAEVAAAVGFSDQSHLTRQFKRILGTTPKKARR